MNAAQVGKVEKVRERGVGEVRVGKGKYKGQ